MSSRWKERNASLVEIENVKKKIHARARKMLKHGIGNFVWTSGGGRGKVGGSLEKFSKGEGGEKGRVRLHRARGSVQLGKVASGFAAQGLWLGDRKVGFQVSSEDRSRLPERGTVGEIRRGGR